MRQLCHTFAYMMEHSSTNLIHCTGDSETEGMTISRAMALDDYAAQPQQAGAVVPPVIHTALEGINDRQRDEPREPGENVASEFFAQVSGKHLGHTF
jgi:hypothetical protein